jgi:hypothetical protein
MLSYESSISACAAETKKRQENPADASVGICGRLCLNQFKIQSNYTLREIACQEFSDKQGKALDISEETE